MRLKLDNVAKLEVVSLFWGGGGEFGGWWKGQRQRNSESGDTDNNVNREEWVTVNGRLYLAGRGNETNKYIPGSRRQEGK